MLAVLPFPPWVFSVTLAFPHSKLVANSLSYCTSTTYVFVSGILLLPVGRPDAAVFLTKEINLSDLSFYERG